MLKLEEAIKVVNKDKLKPIHAYETERYFVFFVVTMEGEAIGNDCSYVVERTKGAGRWIHRNEFPLEDAGEYIGEYDID